MASGETTTEVGDRDGRVQRVVTRLVDASEFAMEVLELLTGVVLVFLFAIGLYDLGLNILESIRSGEVFEIPQVVDFLQTVLLLLIIVEVFRTVVAFAREDTIVRIIIDASLVAIARKVIGFNSSDYGSPEGVFINAAAIAVLLLSVIVAFYVVQRVVEAGEPDIPASGTPLVDTDGDAGAGADTDSDATDDSKPDG